MPIQSSKKILGLTRASSSVSPSLPTPKKPPDPTWVKHLNHLSAPSAALIRLRARIYSNKANVLVDSGANGNFISQSYINKHNIPTQAMTNPQRVLLADGHPISADRLALRSPFSVANYNSHVDFAVLPINGYDAILGMPWLKEVSPVIDWSSQRVTIGTSVIHLGANPHDSGVFALAHDAESSIHPFRNVPTASCINTPNHHLRMVAQPFGCDSPRMGVQPRPTDLTPTIENHVPTCSESSSACSRTLCSSNQAYLHRNPFQPLENTENQCQSVSLAPIAVSPEPSSGAPYLVESSSESCSPCSRTREQSFQVSNSDIPVNHSKNTSTMTLNPLCTST
jgi:hypothetical protein